MLLCLICLPWGHRFVFVAFFGGVLFPLFLSLSLLPLYSSSFLFLSASNPGFFFRFECFSSRRLDWRESQLFLPWYSSRPVCPSPSSEKCPKRDGSLFLFFDRTRGWIGDLQLWEQQGGNVQTKEGGFREKKATDPNLGTPIAQVFFFFPFSFFFFLFSFFLFLFFFFPKLLILLSPNSESCLWHPWRLLWYQPWQQTNGVGLWNLWDSWIWHGNFFQDLFFGPKHFLSSRNGLFFLCHRSFPFLSLLFSSSPSF